MCIPPLKKCFFIFPLSFGVASIAFIEVFVSLLNIIAVVLYEHLDTDYNEEGSPLIKEQELEATSLTIKLKLSSDILIIFTSILLFIGAYRRKLLWLIPFIIQDFLHIILIGFYIFEKLTTEANAEIIITQLIFIVYHGYIWWVVRSFYEEIKIEHDIEAYSHLGE